MKKLIDKMLGRRQIVGTTPHLVEVTHSAPYVSQQALDAASKRIGMWVVAHGVVGILTGTHADAAEVTLAKPDGSTLMEIGPDDAAVPSVVVLPFAELRQALVHEIPESRRPDPALLTALGYQ